MLKINAKNMNLKLRINLIITLMLALTMLLGAWMMINNAQEDVRAEVDSTTTLALHLLDAEVLHYTTDFAWTSSGVKNKTSIFRLQTLESVRHLKIEFFDAFGRLRDSNRATNVTDNQAPPWWFKKLMSSVSSSLTETHRPIIVNSRILGELVITPDPSYEIAEIWDDTLGLLTLGFLFFIVLNALVYWAVDRALNPLGKVLSALTQLEHGHLEARLPPFSLPELSNISSKFNAMAQTLENSMQNNHRLTHQIIRLQEDERKNIAHDLHDEIGQHLTAIHIDASAILNAKKISSAHASAIAIGEVARQMMGIVREMLQRLRPGILYELGLQAALEELIDSWRQRNRGVNLVISISSPLNNLNEVVAITIYRIVQECFTNVTKYANARVVTIKIERQADHLKLMMGDDGRGFNQRDATKGFGLAGMRERVEGLGGTFMLNSSLGAGVQLEVSLPIHIKAVS